LKITKNIPEKRILYHGAESLDTYTILLMKLIKDIQRIIMWESHSSVAIYL